MDLIVEAYADLDAKSAEFRDAREAVVAAEAELRLAIDTGKGDAAVKEAQTKVTQAKAKVEQLGREEFAIQRKITVFSQGLADCEKKFCNTTGKPVPLPPGLTLPLPTPGGTPGTPVTPEGRCRPSSPRRRQSRAGTGPTPVKPPAAACQKCKDKQDELKNATNRIKQAEQERDGVDAPYSAASRCHSVVVMKERHRERGRPPCRLPQ
jgi:hypothetical protein